MIQIHLPKGKWLFDEHDRLGSAGFGEVFAGESASGEVVAVKRLRADVGLDAHRELQMAGDLALGKFQYVIPVLDSGIDQTTERYYIVMAKAERSLSQELNLRKKLPEQEAVAILLNIVMGLMEVRHIVHRDLKPANVLCHGGHWKVADFGIARFADASTSPNTLKECRTDLYAAPEQFRFETSTNATDVYALGCVGYELVAGEPPFCGPDIEAQHLREVPPKLTANSPAFVSLISMMLRKVAASRPSLERVRDILNSLSSVVEYTNRHGPNLGSIAKAGEQIALEESVAETLAIKQQKTKHHRSELKQLAENSLADVFSNTFAAIERVAPLARMQGPSPNGRNRRIFLGNCYFGCELFEKIISDGAFNHGGWDVLHGATLKVQQREPVYEWGGNLWYACMPGSTEFRWFEIGYFFNPLLKRKHQFAPFSVDENQLEKAASAAGKGMSELQHAYGPFPIDDENIDDFIERWSAILARAVSGMLQYPSHLPLTGKWWLKL